jgi:serine/threonine-protein kinase ULK/ATG1
MHRNGIIHRDLKPDNILIHNGVFKIADLGFSKEISKEEITNHTCLGTKATMAPEVVNGEPYGLKADIWSIGVIFFMMV